jgi:Arc/MetJ family transcription regulator
MAGANACATLLHMKRTTLVLDERLLAEAVRILKAPSYSAGVNTALREVIRLAKIREIPRFFESGIWEGDLAEMRRDRHRPGLPRPR